jgi:hypothetical protein
MKKYGKRSDDQSPVYRGKKCDIKTDELRKIIFPLQKLLAKLKSRLTSGRYTVMIGDDASGRVPALILNQIQNKCRLDKKTPLYFMAGSRETKTIRKKKAEIRRFIQKKLRLPKGALVLLVTEYIHHGDSMLLLTDVLRSLSITYEICTLSVCRHRSISTPASLSSKLGTKILFGMKAHSSLDGNYVLAGVQKSYEDVLATRYHMTKTERAIFRKSRKDVTRIAEFLHNKLF